MKAIWKKMVALIMALFVGVTVLPASALAAGNSIANATPISLGKTYSGAITPTNFEDFYKFTLKSSGKISVAANANIKSMYYEIYDATGEYMDGEMACWDNVLGANRIKFNTYLTKGTYYFAVVDSNTGDYTFKISFTSANESFTETGNGTNNTMLTANRIAINKLYRGMLGDNDWRDFYKFNVNYSGKTILTANAEGKEVEYSLYNGLVECLWRTTGYKDSISGKNHIVEKLQLKKGTYYLAIEHGSGWGLGNYTFMLSRYLSKPSISKIYNTSSGVKLQWKKSSGAAGYQVYRRAGSGKWTKVKTTKAASWTDTKAKTNGAKYQYKVYAYNGSAKSAASATKTIYRLSGSAIKSAYNSAGKKLTVKWSRNTKASGYQIKYVTGSRSKTITVKGNKNVKKVIKNLKKGKTYKVYVRSYKNVSKAKYVSAWSKAKSVKIKK